VNRTNWSPVFSPWQPSYSLPSSVFPDPINLTWLFAYEDGRSTPSQIFIDEIDSLFRSRATGDHEVTGMIKAEFMT